MPTEHKTKEPLFEYSYITDGIYIGTNQCCQTHFDEQLLKKGITADMSLEKESIDAPFGVHFYTWIPIEDHYAPTMEQFEFGVSTLEKFVSMDKKVYLHCKNGHGRAPSMMAGYLIKKGARPEEAITSIKEKRPSIHLEKVQEEGLKAWHERMILT